MQQTMRVLLLLRFQNLPHIFINVVRRLDLVPVPFQTKESTFAPLPLLRNRLTAVARSSMALPAINASS